MLDRVCETKPTQTPTCRYTQSFENRWKLSIPPSNPKQLKISVVFFQNTKKLVSSPLQSSGLGNNRHAINLAAKRVEADNTVNRNRGDKEGEIKAK